MEIEKRDILETFSVSYYTFKGKRYFNGRLVLNDGEYKISMKTKDHKTFNDAAGELKELLIKAYAKADS